jgi:alpha-L-rhamnosidase
MKKILSSALTALLLLSCNLIISSDIEVSKLQCNNMENPIGTGNNPNFNWIVPSGIHGAQQTAYQIVLDSVSGNFDPQSKFTWNSGKVLSAASTWIPYSGPELKSGTKYYWRLRLWDNKDNPTGWSKPAFFITGLFQEKDWSGAKWIGYEEIPDSLLLIPGVHGNGNNLGPVAKNRTVIPYFRKEFDLKKNVRQAIIFVSGLGHYELYVNGKKKGDRFLSPGWTNYQKTCFYNTYDITEMINRGENTIGAIVGNGFYNINRERYRKLVIAFGAPKLILKLEVSYVDGSKEVITTNETWQTSPSPITFTSIYGGEDYDARLEQFGWNKAGFDDSGWKKALIVREPEGILRPESDYPVKLLQTLEPEKIIYTDSNLYVYDFGQNASGIIKLKVKGKKGEVVRLLPGELIGKDSLVTQRASGSPYYFTYTLKGGKEEIWAPRFTYYGFRYLQVEGAVPVNAPNPWGKPVISGLDMLHTRNSSPVIGSFKCSNELFNSIYELINWSIKSNMTSVATDCPHREKLGWLEQTHLMGNSIKYIYDIHNLYAKIIDDMIESQLENGLVPDIAPEYVPFTGGFRDSPEWGSAAIILPWDLYEWYGDTNAVRKAYPMMKKYLSYLHAMAEDNILSHGLGDWYDLGPKFPGEAQLTPKALTATSIYFYDTKLLSEMSLLIGENEDALYYKNLAEEIRITFNKKFFNAETKVYSTGSQTAYSMPLFFGMVDETSRKDVVANLVTSILKNNKSLTAGDIGYRYLLRVLEEEGNSQLIYEMNSKRDVPGYGFQLSKGATSLTESWAGLKDVSNNHMMLGHLMEWFFSGIGGIRQVTDSKSYENLMIAPEPVGDLKWAETSFRTIHGQVLSSWDIKGNYFTLKVRIPANSKASVIIPQSDPEKVMIRNKPVRSSSDVISVSVMNGKTICEVSSGVYVFKAAIINF